MNELAFLDIAILKKIDSDSSVKKFGSMINTSFFETANLLGTLKIKGYINIEPSVGGISKVMITDAGSSILSVAEQRSKGEVEPLDNAILHAVAGGAREAEQLQHQLNIRSADLAFHLNKLVACGFMDYEVRSAKVYLVLTEMGFNSTGAVRMQQKLGTPAPQPAVENTGASAPIEAAKSEPPAHFPPWVKGEEAAHKEDVSHILKEEGPKGIQTAKRSPIYKKDGQDDAKRREKTSRMISKLEYYIVEYAPYLLLIIVVAAIFAAAIFLSYTKMSL
jgi:hypothetical protein